MIGSYLEEHKSFQSFHRNLDIGTEEVVENVEYLKMVTEENSAVKNNDVLSGANEHNAVVDEVNYKYGCEWRAVIQQHSDVMMGYKLKVVLLLTFPAYRSTPEYQMSILFLQILSLTFFVHLS